MVHDLNTTNKYEPRGRIKFVQKVSNLRAVCLLVFITKNLHDIVLDILNEFSILPICLHLNQLNILMVNARTSAGMTLRNQIRWIRL